jgi:hypothetical protein
MNVNFELGERSAELILKDNMVRSAREIARKHMAELKIGTGGSIITLSGVSIELDKEFAPIRLYGCVDYHCLGLSPIALRVSWAVNQHNDHYSVQQVHSLNKTHYFPGVLTLVATDRIIISPASYDIKL